MQVPDNWTGPLAGVSRGSAPAPLSKKIWYLMGIRYLLLFPCWSKIAYNSHKIVRKNMVKHLVGGCKGMPPCLRKFYI